MSPKKCSGAETIRFPSVNQLLPALLILLASALSLPAGTSYFEADYAASFEISYAFTVKGTRAAAYLPLPVTFEGAGNSHTLGDLKISSAVDPCERQLLFSSETGRVCMLSWEYLEKACEVRIGYTVELKAAARIAVRQALPLTKDHLGKNLWDQTQKRKKQYQKIKGLRRECNRLRSGIHSQAALVERVCNWISDNNHRAFEKNVNRSKGDSYTRAEIGRVMLAIMGIPANVVPVRSLPDNKPYYLMEVYYPDAGWLLYDMSGNMRHAVQQAFLFAGNSDGIWVEQDGLWEQLRPEITVKQVKGPKAGGPPQARHVLLTPRAKVFSARIDAAGKLLPGLKQSVSTCYRQFTEEEKKQYTGKRGPVRLFIRMHKDRAGQEQKSHGRLAATDIVYQGKSAVLIREQWFYAIPALKPEPLRIHETLAVFTPAGALLRADVYDRFAQLPFRKALPGKGWKQSLEVKGNQAELTTVKAKPRRIGFDDPVPVLSAGYLLLMPDRIARQLAVNLDGYFVFPDLQRGEKVTGSFAHQNDEQLKDPEGRMFTAHKMTYGSQQFLWLDAGGAIVRQEGPAGIIMWESLSRVAAVERQLRGKVVKSVQEYQQRK
ncbi:hypothetical protein ACFL4W_00650 [Planctomycetota bacterium]